MTASIATLDQIPTAPLAVAAPSSEATRVEQARAVAEVLAAVQVAQQCPRDITRAWAEMQDACGRMAVAERAFYSVRNRGNGKSVHLARELARIWGNLDYGVRELRRDDDAGQSEVLAYAWDQQNNVRPTRSFVHPHARMKGGKREPLVDLNDIYLSNQNIGARAVRECIFAVLPDALVEEAADVCRRTVEQGEGKPLSQRIDEMVRGFAALGVSVPQLERRTDRKRGQWTAGDVANLRIDYTTITRDGLAPSELFADQVTAEEVVRGRPTPAAQDDPEVPPPGADGM